MNRIDLQILVTTAWVILTVVVAAPFIVRDARGDGALLRFVRACRRVVFPIHRQELQDEIGAGIRVALFLAVIFVVVVAWLVGREWWLAGLLAAAVLVPTVTIPISLVHTVLLRLLVFRGPIVSTALGVVLGVITTWIVRVPDYHNVLIALGGIYGLVVGIRGRVWPRGQSAERDAPL